MDLFQPDKYRVHLGSGSKIGFCTVWNEPEAVFKLAPVLKDKAAIIGTLYGRGGVLPMIRNLALNPSIRRLYLWGHGALSNTKFGVIGSEVVKTLWTQPIADDGTIQGTSFKLEPEVDPAIVRRIVENVELVDVSSEELSGAMTKLEDPSGSAYMDPVAFPDPVPQAVERFPSELVGWLVHGRTVVEAWQRVVQRIMTYGATKGTQYGLQQKELISVSWAISDEDPDVPSFPADWPLNLRELIGATKDATEQYFQVFLSCELPSGISYTYGNRMMAYPGPSGAIDQIAEVIEKNFRASPDTRRGLATTVVPWIDKDSNEPPCLALFQCLQTHGALHAMAVFRSHDIFKAAIPNALGLRKLQKVIAERLGFSLGQLLITSQSAHIYEAEWNEAKKVAACAFVERPVDLVFRAEDADPRGNAVLRLDGDQLVLTLMSPDGAEVLVLKEPSARHMQKRISQLDLFSRPDHLLDIGMELQKAQIAKERGLAYTQDRPLVL